MAEVKVYSFIGKKRNSYDTNEYMSGTQFTEAIEKAAATDAEQIKVSINSGGGSVTEGYAMISAMQKCAKPVKATIDGYAASMGYYICLGASTITAAENSILMLHSVQGSAQGSPDDLRAEAELLDKFNATMATILAKRTGLTEAEATEKYLGKEVWLTAQEALDAKLIDAIENYKAENIPAVSAGMSQEEATEVYAAHNRHSAEHSMLDRVAAFVKEKFGLKEQPAPVAMLSEQEEQALSYVLYGVKCAADDAYGYHKNVAMPKVKDLLNRIADANASFVVELVNTLYGPEETQEPEAKAAAIVAKVNTAKTGEVETKATELAKQFVAEEMRKNAESLKAASAEIEKLTTELTELKAQPAAGVTKVVAANTETDNEGKPLTREELEAKWNA